MKNATLRQLRVFECVARHLNFTRAAEELHLTQPAVSTQVKELEAHAGQRLFEKLGRKIYLTRAGAELLAHSRAIIQQFHEAEEAMKGLQGIRGGRLNVAVISAAAYFFPRLLAEFTRRHPGAVLNLAVHNREEVVRALEENLTDLAIMVRPPKGQDMVCERFAPHPFVIVAAPTHPLARQKEIALGTLAREPFIAREPGSNTWQTMSEAFRGRLPKLNIVMQTRSNEAIKQAVMAGLGVSFLSAYAVQLERQVGSLAFLDVKGFPLLLDWYVVHRRKKHLSAVATAFKRFLIEEGAPLIARITGVRTRTGPRPRRSGTTA
jgi:DNA-binding transcriptional LysR family regulator